MAKKFPTKPCPECGAECVEEVYIDDIREEEGFFLDCERCGYYVEY